MEVQLKELIEKIKSEGVQTAEEQSAEIIREAEKKADDLLEKAEHKSSIIIENAKSEAARFESSAREALRQAGRDLILATRKSLEELFDKVLEEETGNILKGDYLTNAVSGLIDKWKDDLTDITILLPENQIKDLEEGIRHKVADKLKEGFEIKPVQGIKSGFRLSNREGSLYYDFTSTGLAEILSELLNPRIAALLQESAAGEA